MKEIYKHIKNKTKVEKIFSLPNGRLNIQDVNKILGFRPIEEIEIIKGIEGLEKEKGQVAEYYIVEIEEGSIAMYEHKIKPGRNHKIVKITYR